jgi:hypothetical protein
MMIIRHKVWDYGHSRPMFDAHAEAQKVVGLIKSLRSRQVDACAMRPQ